ncbi:Rho GTPase activation protein [Choanephora cucurbitarum]|nr:Rho GTPase activation protein [Choanephora cucurbitarum]
MFYFFFIITFLLFFLSLFLSLFFFILMTTLDATHSQKILFTWWKKVKLQNVGLYDTIRAEKAVFGVALTDSLQYAHSSITYHDKIGTVCNGILPIVVAKCGAFLKEKGLSTEGVFRISGNAKRIATLQSIFDAPEEEYGISMDWQGYTVHDASNLIRRYLNQLPEPVISLDCQMSFKMLLDAPFAALEDRVNAIQRLIHQLPLVHQFLLLYLLDLLYLFSLHADVTRMNLSSLATAFAPVIFSDPKDGLNLARYKDFQRVLEFLVLNQHMFCIPRISADDIWKETPRRLSDTYKRTEVEYLNSQSVTDLSNKIISKTLKRSNTAPSHHSSLSRPSGNWKSIKIIGKNQVETL